MSDLYEELLGPKDEHDANFERVDRKLTAMVVGKCCQMANQVNSGDANEQIFFLLQQGVTEDAIKEYVGKA